MLRVDSVESLLGVRAPFACPISAPNFRPREHRCFGCFTPVFGYTRMHNFSPAHSRRCEFAHLCSGGVRLLFEVRAWLHF